MWITKISVPYLEKGLLSSLARKHQVSIIGYPLGSDIRKSHVDVIGSGFIQGEEANIKRFISALGREDRVLNAEFQGNFFVAQIRQHIANRWLFQPGIFHVKPSVVNRSGEYIFELGSWDKEKLMKVIHAYTKAFGGKLLFIRQQKTANIQTVNIYPPLTAKQKRCLQLAVSNRYYDFPRKITLKQLAGLARISYSTYQFHLQNAERKVMPFLDTLV